jgi:hypothetical protein
MITVCPNCGFRLSKELANGLSQCNNCNKIFETSFLNELLSASWEARKNDLYVDTLGWKTKLDKDIVDFVHYFVCVKGYSHDEFLALIKKFQSKIDGLLK